MDAFANVYKPSGEKGKALWLVPLITLPVIALLSFLYGYVCVYNPLAGVVSFLIPLGYGAAIACTLFGAGKIAHCRNDFVMWSVSLGCALLAIYLAWASFLCVLSNRYSPAGIPSIGFWDVLTQPVEMWEFMLDINKQGWFTVKSMTPSGIILSIFWLCEAGIIGGLIVWWPNSLLNACVYCEPCGDWCKETKNIARFEDPHTSRDIAPRIKAGDLVALAELGDVPKGLKSYKSYLRLDTQRCEKCSETATFQVVHVSNTVKDGKNTESENKWTQHVLLNPASLQAFQAALVSRATQKEKSAEPTTLSVSEEKTDGK